MKKRLVFCICVFAALFSLSEILYAAGVEGAQKYMIGKLEFLAIEDRGTDMSIDLLLEPKAAIVKQVIGTKKSVPASINAFFIKTDKHNVLIDSGNPGGAVADKLKKAGIDIDKIDIVLLTHMHGDHIGGLLDADGNKIFKNAKVFVSKDERDYWLLNPSARAANAALAKKVIDTYGKQFALLEWDKNNIVDEIKALKAVGHTPGHTIFEIVSEGKKILVVGDLVHLTIIQFADPNLSVSFDIDPAQAAKTRKEVLQYAYDNKIEIAGMHIPFSGVGTVLKDKAPRLYRFQPEK